MLVKIFSGVSLGLGSQLVEVEVDVSNGFPTFEIIGLGDKSIEEAKERVKLAIKNSGLQFPSQKRIIVNLAPADLKKEGPIFDLPIALGILLASEKISLDLFPKNYLFAGELSLNGELRHSKGILPLVCLAQEKNLAGIFLPLANLQEANLVRGLKIIPLTSLKSLLAHLSQAQPIEEVIGQGAQIEHQVSFEIDFSMIQGQEQAKRALEIVAAGSHNLLMACSQCY